ncbi:AAA family ATPase [Candidatus Absconditicoccus praedator]|uniref:AAA family ATPase n=1 Tax=Candidatus Absconditicoccus praedator TaxID=2735562 RepID=UPI001E56B78A|nr:AAA family ATPase [Candidatus Absconditicoccus praedator]UFX82933.1 DNA repair protein RadA [Candidatus Absconditicoccus praedator]
MYNCKECGYASITKLGKCPNCGAFASMQKDETKIKPKKSAQKTTLTSGVALESKLAQSSQFFDIKNTELKRVYQNGIKQGGVYLLGGQPGIGKSTIILQIIQDLIENNKISIGYFSGEESQDQIYSRLKRIKKDSKFQNLDIYTASSIEDIVQTISEKDYDFFVIDSIQTIYSNNIDGIAGSPSQVKFCSEKIGEFAKQRGKTCFIIGHVTKGGEIAGPKYLEHIVDMVSYLEGDRFGQYRFLRSMKNRFGSTDDISIFEMGLFGLTPVYDIKERIINTANTSIPGSVFTMGIDNGRPVIVNLEVLLNKTNYKYPQRMAVGIDNNRLNLVIAILERYLKLNLGYFDIYVNLPGEFKFYDSGLDLALATAIFSQYQNKLVDKNSIFVGEIGLGGQLLPSKLHEKRKNETPEGFKFVDKKLLNHVVELKKIF